MRLFIFPALVGLLMTSLVIADREVVSTVAQLNAADIVRPHLVGTYSRGRGTSYRGSGRREILAFPTLPTTHV